LQALADVSLEIEQGEFFGVGDVAPWFSATIVAAALLALSSLALWLIKTGYKLRH
jgi:ABC-2 type transport system permease protein